MESDNKSKTNYHILFDFACVINSKCNKSYLQGGNNLIRITWGVIMCAVLHGV